MAEYKATRDRNRPPTHPGIAMDDILGDLPVSKTEIAAMLGISRNQLHSLLTARKPLSAEIAVRVAALLGGSPESWLRMQADHDAWHAARAIDVRGIKRLAVG